MSIQFDIAKQIIAETCPNLNAFLKKSTKDYQKQINLAESILNRISNEGD